MKSVINFLSWGAPRPHAPQAGAAPETLRFYSGLECLMG